MFNGTFLPSQEAKALSTAPHLNNPSTSAVVRFSSSTGIPQIPDTDGNANPRGIAIRFVLGEHAHTDIVAHSTPFFPARTGEDFLELLKAIGASPPGTPSPSPVEKHLGLHPAALAFVQAPKPPPSSFAKEAFYGVSALKFVNAEGKEQYFRYRILPAAGEEHLDDAALKGKGPNYLFEELPDRVIKEPMVFKIVAQLAEEGDQTDDATVRWPDSRKIVELGTLKVEKLMSDSDKEQKQIIYDPRPQVKGLEPSADPLFDLRAAVYLVSGKERRAA